MANTEMANFVRLGKVSFFDLGVSRKSPIAWHFLAVFQRPQRQGGLASKSRI
jgi:hypothetical protein